MTLAVADLAIGHPFQELLHQINNTSQKPGWPLDDSVRVLLACSTQPCYSKRIDKHYLLHEPACANVNLDPDVLSCIPNEHELANMLKHQRKNLMNEHAKGL